jgi:lactoylglutathione lyase
MFFLTATCLFFRLYSHFRAIMEALGRYTIGFNHVAIWVTDLAVSSHFYGHILGLQSIPEPFQEGRHAWFSLGPGLSLHVVAGAAEQKQYFQSHHTCLSVTDLEAFMERLSGNGVVYYDSKGNAGAIKVRPDGVRQIYFQDPDGYWWEVNDEWATQQPAW